jgi:hypothetical protein
MKINVRPQNLWLNNGTAVIIGGLDNAPEFNGLRGLIGSFNEEKARYNVFTVGRLKPLGLRSECCQVEGTCNAAQHREPEVEPSS